MSKDSTFKFNQIFKNVSYGEKLNLEQKNIGESVKI